MSMHPFPFAALTLAGWAMLPLPPAVAQTDPAALRLIEQLRPRAGDSTRGIRVPAPADATPPPMPVAPANVPVPPRPVPPPRPVTPAAAPATTTAPEGVAAASITVTFPSGSATLTPQAEARLAPLGQALTSTALSAYRFRIEGHTDSVGNAAMNQALSERRAAAVRDYLIRRYGVSASRLESVGLGQTQLLVPTGDGVNEPRNRRVQVINLDG